MEWSQIVYKQKGKALKQRVRQTVFAVLLVTSCTSVGKFVEEKQTRDPHEERKQRFNALEGERGLLTQTSSCTLFYEGDHNPLDVIEPKFPDEGIKEVRG